ncbi:unnamed protein product [Dictyota dichotoma]
MPKIKTRKSAKKRYKSISGKRFIRRQAFKSHILQKKSKKRKRKLSGNCIVSKADTKMIQYMLVY